MYTYLPNLGTYTNLHAALGRVGTSLAIVEALDSIITNNLRVKKHRSERHDLMLRQNWPPPYAVVVVVVFGLFINLELQD